MIDCEIVLRFFAFRDLAKIRGSVRKILDECMKTNRDASETQIATSREVFHRNLKLADAIFRPRTFQVQYADGQWRRSQALFDAVMVSLDGLIPHKKALIEARSSISKALAQQLKNKKSYEIIVGKPNTAKAVKQRIKIVSTLLKRHA